MAKKKKIDEEIQTEEASDVEFSADGNDEIEILKQKAVECEDRAKRAEAELVNFKRRMEQEKQEFVKFAGKRTIMEFLNVLDTFQLALSFTPEDLKSNQWVIGMQQVLRQFEMTLESLSVKKMKTVGEKVDYSKHEVLGVVDGEKDIIVREVQAGYMLNDQVLRVAKVEVGH